MVPARYQSLICSLAYSTTGNLNQSEDLAQQTFLAAWTQLRGLRDPEKLRSWLCRIVRNLSWDAVREQHREPTQTAEPLGDQSTGLDSDLLPYQEVISREEETILWRALEQVPSAYREPLILFYREAQSIERVASLLGISEDAVKQRLSRGRRLLSNQVTALVEGTLKRSAPGHAFTAGVLMALPVFTGSLSAATLGTAVAKGGTGAKAASMLGMLAAVLGPLLAFWVPGPVTGWTSTGHNPRVNAISSGIFIGGC